MTASDTFASILFDDLADPDGLDGRAEPDISGDLNLDQVVTAVTRGRDSYNLTPYVYTPVREGTIAYRHTSTPRRSPASTTRSRDSRRAHPGSRDYTNSCSHTSPGHIREQGLVLFNESFAATNEREGSEINRQIIQALYERHVGVVTVTHLYDPAHDLDQAPPERSVFLRAERRPDGRRTFKVVPGEPLPTSYGTDLYHPIFGVEDRHKQPVLP